MTSVAHDIIVSACSSGGDEDTPETVVGIYITDSIADSIQVFSVSATGDAAPLRTIAGAATGLANPIGIAVDNVHREIFIANVNGDSILVFSSDAYGNVAPLRTLTGANLNDIALDVGAAQYVGVDFVSSIKAWARTATGAAAPVRTITGAQTALGNPTCVSVVR